MLCWICVWLSWVCDTWGGGRRQSKGAWGMWDASQVDTEQVRDEICQGEKADRIGKSTIDVEGGLTEKEESK